MVVRLGSVKLLNPVSQNLCHDDPGEFPVDSDFFELTGKKRIEDGGHDIRIFHDFALNPRCSATLMLPFTVYGGPGRSAYVLGRSSLNASGLEIIPSKMRDGKPCTFDIINKNNREFVLSAGDRIAQIILMQEDNGLNIRNDLSGKDNRKCNRLNDALPCRLVSMLPRNMMTTERGEAGFGSTGIA
ncbi:dUTPase [Psittacid alphaherpesvirus 5]|uniref:dUTPase n=1 Tax=Psittacid alphaherpesvirus 5 TaxID=2972693 RepID=A0A5P9JWW4_9ALPH|nr:dUTPase [Psittacid alphaherpesvirus 5]QFU14554.1 dUTPase [Psittacid alphaherpesvirus 5]UOO01025.1 dUTPase [Psittacid alphaherpesvirus 5]